MKKNLYILLFVAVSSVSFSACTEENVEPKQEETTGGNNGGGNDPICPAGTTC